MPQDILKLIVTVLFFVVIVMFALISILGVYIFIKYGRTPSLTLIISLIFIGIFFIAGITAFTTLQQLAG